MTKDIETLYSLPFPSTRSGALFNAFSYPTKISPEAEAVFIACHTDVGATVLDPFGGSGTTGIATLLADAPTQQMQELANGLGLKPKWGPRKAVVYELSPMGCLLGNVMCGTKPADFKKYAEDLLKKVSGECSFLYEATDDKGEIGVLRHAIWTDYILCPDCQEEMAYGDAAISYNPIRVNETAICPHCGKAFKIADAERAKEEFYDNVLAQKVSVKKRRPYKLYGKTGKRNWCRMANDKDFELYSELVGKQDTKIIPLYKLKWGELYRNGYHYGISHLHQFYTQRNALVFSCLWNKIKDYPTEIQDALKIFLLSYNSAHSTLMTRVVVKKNNPDFVITGAQPGVLYISGLPLEKNIFLGLQRKISTFVEALEKTAKSHSSAEFVNASSTKIELPTSSVDYVFTDPPFGDFIPYSEINQINEAWLGFVTDNKEEAIINPAQNKGLEEYALLMNKVLAQVSSVLKPEGRCTLVFHSAKSAIWRAIVDAYKNAGLSCEKASILDKVQCTFKQTNSNVTVKGDPLLLLRKEADVEICESRFKDDKELALYLIDNAGCPYGKAEAVKTFSKYIMMCLESNLSITCDAKVFFQYDK